MNNHEGDMLANRDRMRGMLEPQYQQMITDGGYSPVHKGRLIRSIIGGLSGAKQQFDSNLGRDVAAMGMGNTGLKTRNMLKANNNYMQEISDARNQIELDSRNDFWNALNGAQGMYEGLHGMTRDYTAAKQNQEQIDQNGFWGTFKRSLGQGMGGGMGRSMFGGGQ